MNRAQTIAVAVSVATVTALAVVAAPAVATVAAGLAGNVDRSQKAVSSPTAAAPATPASAEAELTADVPEGYVDIGDGTAIPAGGPGDCEASAYIWIGSNAGEPTHGEMRGGPLEDMGARELAAGAVTHDANGRPVTYAVQPGDAPNAIGDRFCFDNPSMLDGLNHSFALQPGQVLRLTADPELRFVSLLGPEDAPVGESVIPYRQAFFDMGLAADAGDVSTMRSIWNDRMSVLVPNAAEHEFLASSIAEGDIEKLRQIFS